MDGLVVVQSFEKSEHKECIYEEGKLVRVEREVGGYFTGPFDIEWFWQDEGEFEDADLELAFLSVVQQIRKDSGGQRVTFGNQLQFTQEEDPQNYEISFKDVNQLDQNTNDERERLYSKT